MFVTILHPLRDAWATLLAICGETEASAGYDCHSQRHWRPPARLRKACMNRKYRSASWVDPRIEIRESPGKDNGSFALAPIGAGEIVTVWGGQVFTLAQIQPGKARKKSLVALGEGLYLGEEMSDEPYRPGPDHYLNH